MRGNNKRGMRSLSPTLAHITLAASLSNCFIGLLKLLYVVGKKWRGDGIFFFFFKCGPNCNILSVNEKILTLRNEMPRNVDKFSVDEN